MGKNHLVALILACVVAPACGGKLDEEAPAGGAAGASADCSGAVVTTNELFVVDDAVIGRAEAQNGERGPWSFRYLVEQMGPAGADAGQLVSSWLSEWSDAKELNGFALDADGEGRAEAMRSMLTCPWLQRTPSNACTADCSKCAARRLDLAEAPFRLLAIINRMDVGGQPWARTPAGEARFIFALTRGAADDAGAPVLPMTVSIEYALPPTRSVREWASLWHALGSSADVDAYSAKLADLTERFTSRGVAPDRPNGSALAQVRTNDHALAWIAQLREFAPGPDGRLHPALLLNTPAESLNGSARLRDFVRDNEELVRAGRYVLPPAMEAGSANLFSFRWTIPGIERETVDAFTRGTCNGCHGTTATLDTAFHVSPFRAGSEKLSPFALGDELPRRLAATKAALCAQ